MVTFLCVKHLGSIRMQSANGILEIAICQFIVALGIEKDLP